MYLVWYPDRLMVTDVHIIDKEQHSSRLRFLKFGGGSHSTICDESRH
jgi:hypothetical protein